MLKRGDSLCWTDALRLRTRNTRSRRSVMVLAVLACLLTVGGVPMSGQEAKVPATAGLGFSISRPAQMAPLPDMVNLTIAQYDGAVSMAMEGMRLVYGDMTEEEEAKFEAKWRPLFGHPSEEVIAYFNKLNPLLLEFIAVRTALNDAAEAHDAVQLEVAAAASIGDFE